MREPIENISLLQKQINNLQLENQILKSILDRSGISYTHEIARIGEPEKAEGYDPDQGARVIRPRQITVEMANLFYARFWGRQDVYARRSEKKPQEKQDITHSVTIGGRTSVLKCVMRK